MSTTGKYTVIGYYDDTGQIFSDHVNKDCVNSAMSFVESKRPDATLVCAVEGFLSEGEGITFADDSTA